MAVGLGCMTIVLEEGQRHDWYGSTMIGTLTVIGVVSLIFFLILELTAEKPFINLRLFAIPTIGWSNLLSTVVGAVSYGSLFLIPVFLVTFFLQDHLLRGVTFGTVKK